MGERPEHLRAPVLVTGAAVVVCLVSFLVDLRVSVPVGPAKLAGILLVVLGMGLVLWAAAYLKGSLLGAVQPLGELVQTGPYRLVRHPVYAGMAIAACGIPVSTRSWLGLLAVFLLFLPALVYRARLEEEALQERFGAAWEEYVLRTGFFLPRLPQGESHGKA